MSPSFRGRRQGQGRSPNNAVPCPALSPDTFPSPLAFPSVRGEAMRTHNTDAPIDVLIAEDDRLLRQTIRCLLEAQGYTCAEAGDGRAAVALARQRPPRCVLLDLGLPELDGFSVARHLRSDPRTRAA